MRKTLIAGAIALVAITTPAVVSAASTSTPQTMSCVKYGPSGGKDATGNYMLYNWNKSKCPSGTYAVNWNTQGQPGTNGTNGKNGTNGILSSKTTDLGGKASVVTGGSFVTNASDIGELTFPAGTFMVTVNAKATPNQPSGDVQIYPLIAMYNQPVNSDFAGNLLNVGNGALEYGTNANIDSYYNGVTTVTTTETTEMHFYAFGYDSDRGSSNYNLDDLSVTVTQIDPGS